MYRDDKIRSDIRECVIEMSERLVEPTASRVIWQNNGRVDKETEETIYEMPWDESLIKAGLHLFLNVLHDDHTLLHQLSSVCARANTEIKRVILYIIKEVFKYF